MAEAAALTEEQVGQYVNAMVEFANSGDEVHLNEMFALLDRDGNGTVERTELRAVLLGFAANDTNVVTNEAVDSMLTSLDANGDGKIQKAEFVANMKAKLVG
jgi:Ca2+-binding EF-hand superfamily protein